MQSTLSSLRSVEIKLQGDGSHSAEDSTLMVSFVSSLSVSATCTLTGVATKVMSETHLGVTLESLHSRALPLLNQWRSHRAHVLGPYLLV